MLVKGVMEERGALPSSPELPDRPPSEKEVGASAELDSGLRPANNPPPFITELALVRRAAFFILSDESDRND